MARAPRKPKRKEVPGILEAGDDAVLTVVELQRRLGWSDDVLRTMTRLGLPTIKAGRRRYCISSSVIKWFRQLEQEAGDGKSQPE